MLRPTGPLLAAATVGLFASSVPLLVIGPGGAMLLGLVKASFLTWFGAMVVHVPGHALQVPALVVVDWRSSGRRLAGSRLRRVLLPGALVAGPTPALATLPVAQQWLSWGRLPH